MITIESSPPLVSLTGNPVRFRLATDNHLVEAGAKPAFRLEFWTIGVEGDYFELSWGTTVVRFVCKPVPDQSGCQLPDESVLFNMADWIEVIARLLARNYEIERDFTVIFNSDSLTLTALDYGSNYLISLGDLHWTGYPPEGTTTGSKRKYRPFYKLGVQLLLKIDSVWTKLGEDVLPVNSEGKAIFDLHRLFADQVYSEFKFPEYYDQRAIHRPHHCMEYRIRYFEQFGEENKPGILTESASFYILSAGISRLQEAIYNRQGSSFWAKLGYNQYFLTWQPKSKVIDQYSTEKLYFLVQGQYEEITLRVERFFFGGTSTTPEPKVSIDHPIPRTVYEFSISPLTLDLEGLSGALDYYEVWVADEQLNRISEIRTYRMDYQPHEEVRQFLFRNSLGGFDTLRVTGDMEEGVELERSTIGKILGTDFTEMNHQLAQHSVAETKVYKANTGWLTKEQTAWMRDFFLSRQVYQLVVGKLVPVVVTTTEAMQRKDREDLCSIDFAYRRAFVSEFYSREIVTARFTDAFNDDIANE